MYQICIQLLCPFIPCVETMVVSGLEYRYLSSQVLCWWWNCRGTLHMINWSLDYNALKVHKLSLLFSDHHCHPVPLHHHCCCCCCHHHHCQSCSVVSVMCVLKQWKVVCAWLCAVWHWNVMWIVCRCHVTYMRCVLSVGVTVTCCVCSL